MNKVANTRSREPRLRYQTPQLPDLTPFFLARKRAPLLFVARQYPNLLHDVPFLSSYLNDARFSLKSVKQRDGVVTIDLDRDCQEIGFGCNPHLPKETQMLGAKARLTLSRVKRVKWKRSSRSTLFEISHVYLAFEKFETSSLVLTDSFWRLTVDFEGTPEIELRDLEKPGKVRRNQPPKPKPA